MAFQCTLATTLMRPVQRELVLEPTTTCSLRLCVRSLNCQARLNCRVGRPQGPPVRSGSRVPRGTGGPCLWPPMSGQSIKLPRTEDEVVRRCHVCSLMGRLIGDTSGRPRYLPPSYQLLQDFTWHPGAAFDKLRQRHRQQCPRWLRQAQPARTLPARTLPARTLPARTLPARTACAAHP